MIVSLQPSATQIRELVRQHPRVGSCSATASKASRTGMYDYPIFVYPSINRCHLRRSSLFFLLSVETLKRGPTWLKTWLKFGSWRILHNHVGATFGAVGSPGRGLTG